MKNELTEQADAMSREATPEGELLGRVHRRLVPLHASLASTVDVDRDFRHALVRTIMDVLVDIEANPAFRVAQDAELHRRRTAPTTDELARKARSQAIVDRFRRTRAERNGMSEKP